MTARIKTGIILLVAVFALGLFVMSWDRAPQGEHHHTDQELAKGCHATLDEFRSARAEAKSGAARPTVTVGRCTLRKNADQGLTLNVIEPGQATH